MKGGSIWAVITAVLFFVLSLSPVYAGGEGQKNGEGDGTDTGEWIEIHNFNATDCDGNGRFDALILEFELSERTEENATLFYELSGMGYSTGDYGGHHLNDPGTVKGTLRVVRGEHALTLTIPGTEIYRARLTPPFSIHIRWVGDDGEERNADLQLNARYTYRDFESPYPCGFDDTMEVSGIDTDNNGLFDILRLEIRAFTEKPGNFTVIGELRPAHGIFNNMEHPGQLEEKVENGPSTYPHPGDSSDYPPIYSTPVSFSANTTRIIPLNLTFNGTSIYLSGYPSPYCIRASIYMNGSFVDYTEWEAEGIDYTRFEAPELYGLFTGNYAWERDGEGMNLSVNVKIIREGDYLFTGYPEMDYGYMEGEAWMTPSPVFEVFHLLPGIRNISLLFHGEMHSLYASSFTLTLTTLSTGGKDTLFIPPMIAPIPSQMPGAGKQRMDLFPSDRGTMRDKGVDENRDGRYEILHLELSSDLPAGNYSCLALLYPNDMEERVVSMVSGEFQINEESGKFTFDFPGEDIYLSGMNGPYTVRIFASSDGVEHTFKGKTREYRYTDFSPVSTTIPGPEPRFEMENESLFIHTDVFASRVLKNAPEFSFFYYTDMGESMKFRVRFTKLIAFNDRNGNGVCDRDEGIYQAFLTARNWKITPVSYGINSEMGGYISFNMSTRLNMEPVRGNGRTSPVRDWGVLTLRFLMTSRTVNDTGFSIRGGEEMKVTISIIQNSPLPADHIAVEQMVTGENGNLLRESSGTSLEQGLIFERENGQRMASYSWKRLALIGLKNGTESKVNVGSSVRTENGTIILSLTYPVSSKTASVEHDPSAGVFRESAPYPEIAGEETASPEGYIAGILIAGGAVIATLYYQGMRWKREKGKGKKLK